MRKHTTAWAAVLLASCAAPTGGDLPLEGAGAGHPDFGRRPTAGQGQLDLSGALTRFQVEEGVRSEFWFHGQAGARIRIHVSDPDVPCDSGSRFDPVAELVGGWNGFAFTTREGYSDDNARESCLFDSVIEATLPEDGIYGLRIGELDGWAGTAAYRVECNCADESTCPPSGECVACPAGVSCAPNS